MSSYPTLDYSEQALNDPHCPTCGEKATARLGNWPGREAAEFWDSNAHVWFVRLAAARVAASLRAVAEHEMADASTARQEAETLTRQRDAAIREISVIAREAETLRKQRDEALYEAKQSVSNARVRAVHLVRHERLSKALGMDSGYSADATIDAAIARIEEAETLRGQLDAAQRPHVVTDARLAEQMDEALGEALMELAQAQRALVLLADQLERHSVPFVPAVEAATALARHETANDERLMAVGLRAAQRVYEKARAARAASPVLEPSPSETTNG